MGENDRDSVLSMLMDVTGTTEHINDGIGLLKELNFAGKNEGVASGAYNIFRCKERDVRCE